MTIYDFAFLFLLALIVALWRALVLANRDIERLKRVTQELALAAELGSRSMLQLTSLSRESFASLHKLHIEERERISKFMQANNEAHKKSRDFISAIAGVIEAMQDELRDEFQRELNEQESGK